MNSDPFDGIDPKTGICATVTPYYAQLYPELRQAARELGWALTLHGSMRRDLDLVAVPWTEEARPASELVKALVEASGGFQAGNTAHGFVSPKPHGRAAVTISLGGSGGMIDLSVMPRRSINKRTTYAKKHLGWLVREPWHQMTDEGQPLCGEDIGNPEWTDYKVPDPGFLCPDCGTLAARGTP